MPLTDREQELPEPLDEDAIYDLPPLEKVRALLERARAERRQGRDSIAHAYCIQSLNLFRGHRDREGEAAATLELADLALHHNPTEEDGFARRKRLCEAALALYRELGDKRGTASALRLLASVTPRAEGMQMLEESLWLAREDGDKLGIAVSLERLGAHSAFGDPSRAVTLKGEALALYREAGSRSGEARALFSLGISRSRSDGKRECLEAALQIYRELGYKRQIAEILMLLPGSDLDDDTNIAYYTERRQLSREMGIQSWEASSLRRLADIAEKRGSREQARALRAEADEIYPEQPTPPELMKAFEAALKERDPDAARDTAQQLFGGGERKRLRSKQA